MGITGALKIAHLAEALGLDCEIHASGPAHRHLMAAMRNTNFYEVALVGPDCPNAMPPVYRCGYTDQLDCVDADGSVPVPTGPGLGVDYDWDWIAANRTALARLRSLRRPGNRLTRSLRFTLRGPSDCAASHFAPQGDSMHQCSTPENCLLQPSPRPCLPRSLSSRPARRQPPRCASATPTTTARSPPTCSRSSPTTSPSAPRAKSRSRCYPAEQLGKEGDLIQQVKSGALDISAPSMPSLSGLVPALEIASAPFLWTDWAQAEKIITGPAFQPQFDELRDKHNVLMLSKIWYWGWRNLTTGRKPSTSPKTLPGLKIRVPESPVWVEMIRAMGGAPTPIPFGEVYTALQQKTVDGQENPIPTIYSRKFYEVQAHLSMTRHMLQNNTMIINKRSFEQAVAGTAEGAAGGSGGSVGEELEAAAGTRDEHARGDPQERQDRDRRQARPRRLRRQDGARAAEAGGALGSGAT